MSNLLNAFVKRNRRYPFPSDSAGFAHCMNSCTELLLSNTNSTKLLQLLVIVLFACAYCSSSVQSTHSLQQTRVRQLPSLAPTNESQTVTLTRSNKRESDSYHKHLFSSIERSLYTSGVSNEFVALEFRLESSPARCSLEGIPPRCSVGSLVCSTSTREQSP